MKQQNGGFSYLIAKPAEAALSYLLAWSAVSEHERPDIYAL